MFKIFFYSKILISLKSKKSKTSLNGTLNDLHWIFIEAKVQVKS